MRAHTIPLTATPSLSITWSVDRLRRKARRLAVRFARLVVFCADSYSTAVQYEELAKLSHVDLETRQRGDLHRHIADALPKWPIGG